MKIIVDAKIIATHADDQPVTFEMYPAATAIKRIPDGTPLQEDGTDPTLADPSLILDEEYRRVEDWPTESLRAKRLKDLQQDADDYLDRYDLGAKLAYLGEFCLLLNKKIDGTLTADDQADMIALSQVMLWNRSVLIYYTSVVRQLLISPDNSTLASISWDFTQFDDSDPSVQIVGFY